jgi:CspA family cold shock protein
VKWYNAVKGFGFIVADRGGNDIFVHASALKRSGIMGLAENQRVERTRSSQSSADLNLRRFR